MSFWSICFVFTTLPIAIAAMTNASQPKTAVFQWLALQRPIRAAMLFDCFRGDTASLPFEFEVGVLRHSQRPAVAGMQLPRV